MMGRMQLFEVINQDYNDFVDLSTKLVNVEAAVVQFQAPLEEVQVSGQEDTKWDTKCS